MDTKIFLRMNSCVSSYLSYPVVVKWLYSLIWNKPLRRNILLNFFFFLFHFWSIEHNRSSVPPSRFTVTTCSPAVWRSSPPSPVGLSPASLPAGRRSLWHSRRCWTTGTRVPATWPCRWIAAPPNPSAAAFTSLTSGWCSARSPFSRVTHTRTHKYVF